MDCTHVIGMSLPRDISSAHSLCDENNVGNASPYADVSNAILLFRKNEYKLSRHTLENSNDLCYGAKYILTVMYYDGLGGDLQQELAVKMMKEMISSQCSPEITCCTYYNLGRAYYEGNGVKQSDEEALKLWQKAAADLKPEGCVKAMSVMGMFYARIGESYSDLKKAHYWHQEATGKGSLESQAALGVMYDHGIQVKKDSEAAFKCFKAATERGSVYGTAQLSLQYYQLRMFNNSYRLAEKVSKMEDTQLLSQETDCLQVYVKKGIAMACFICGRCTEQGIMNKINNHPVATNIERIRKSMQWYKKALDIDKDTTHYLQKLVIAQVL